MDQHPIDPMPRYWRSLEELAGESEAGDEFAEGTLELRDFGLSRRRFLQVMGASAALVAAVACDRKGNPLVPYTNRPAEVVPGVTNLYASTFPEGGRAYPVLVRTREGRPIHVSSHDREGKAPLRATADLLGLYDPDRLQRPMGRGAGLSWDGAFERLLEAFKAGPVLILAEDTASPTRRLLLDEVAGAVSGSAWMVWGGLPHPPESLQGWQPHLDEASVVLSLGSDFLGGGEPGWVEAYARRREPGPGMLKLWAVEGPMTLTGANADRRIPLRPSQVPDFALALAWALRAGSAQGSIPSGVDTGAWEELLADLRKAGSRAVALCGPALPAEAHRAVHALNAQLGALGRSLVRESEPLPAQDALASLESGRFRGVLFWGANPLYASADAGRWRRAVERIPARMWMGLREDETSAACTLLLPEHHWLEAWGDHELPGGRMALQQPVLGALFDSRQGEEVLLALLRALGRSRALDYPAYLRDRWRREVQPAGSPVPFDTFFQTALHDGVVKLHRRARGPRQGEVSLPARAALPHPDGFELLLEPDRRLYDGRYANNGWLQELPEPVSKTTWGNPLQVSPSDARRLSLEDGDWVLLQVGQHRLETPVCIQPGQAPGLVSMALGYGRAFGRVAKGVGVNAFPLLEPGKGGLRTGVQVRRLGRRTELPRTQRHHRMEGRDILRIQEVGVHSWPKPHPHVLPSLLPGMAFPENRWGMVVDLNRCVGCSTCVLACQSENNIPVVGPEQVARGREMHWLRIDRYYEGDPANPRAGHQPMMCQHCDHAPCENVCPVNATNHSPDGLNQMVYNRCVGTRYCANNCPYKVRRFNFLEFNSGKKEPENFVHNPEVTVRPRGVMEKCTFCIQRIQDARIRARLDKRSLRDGDIQPACVAACPAGALVFGDLKDPQSQVSRLTESPRAYKVLEELGVRPAVTYLAALRHPLRGGSHA